MNYRLQELGMTKHKDQGFLAKLIGHIGRYRHEVFKQCLQKGKKTKQNKQRNNRTIQ